MFFRAGPPLILIFLAVAVFFGLFVLLPVSLVATALRESREEISLASAHVEIIGALAPARAKSGIRVLPVVGLVHGDPELTANPDEVESIFRVPLQFFMEHAPARDHRINFRGIDLVVPCFRY